MLFRLRDLAEQHARHVLLNQQKGVLLFVSLSDGQKRAQAHHFFGGDFDQAWAQVVSHYGLWLKDYGSAPTWIRIDWARTVRQASLAQVEHWFKGVKRNYMRWGMVMGAQCQYAFTEQELNANAMLYQGARVPNAQINKRNFRAYGKLKYADFDYDFAPEQSVHLVDTAGVFISTEEGPYLLYRRGRNAGRRVVRQLDESRVGHLITTASQYLTQQVQPNGRFYYGWHPCFDREIRFYNTLRHASTVYSMIEAWEVTRCAALSAAIDRALQYVIERFVKYDQNNAGEQIAFLVEHDLKEIKLGANAVLILALTKYSEVFDTKQYLPLLEALALGIQWMQDPRSGQLTHVLNYPDLSIKEKFRVIYYDGEAAFGLMRLYGLTRDARWLAIVEKAFEYFIAAEHWKVHDHWLSYCVNELTRYKEEEKYYRFGIQNVAGHLDFVANRITTFPTLLELMMAAEQMVERLRQSEQYGHLLDELDQKAFYQALEKRARYLLNGYFAPEIAMYFANPQRILGSFFIRHHSFRVRIDDVEHYLSGYVAYLKYLKKKRENSDLLKSSRSSRKLEHTEALREHASLIWAGDVNLGRRQHYRTEKLGIKKTINVPALAEADYRVLNLECVISTLGEQGIDKGEGGPYYYRARPEMIDVLISADIDMVATANNHAGDYGTDALLQQKGFFKDVGIKSIGSGASFKEAISPQIVTIQNINVAFINIDTTEPRFAATAQKPGIAYIDPRDGDSIVHLLTPEIEKAREQAHIVLVIIHLGANNRSTPSDLSKRVARQIIDLGVDGVLGASAHRLQGIEIYKNRPIIYDAGDFLFDSVRQRFKESAAFRLEFNHEGVQRIKIIPVGVGYGQTTQLDVKDAHNAMEHYAALCSELKTKLLIDELGHGKISLNPPQKIKKDCLTFKKPKKKNLTKKYALPSNWTVEEVPVEAKIAPVALGPLVLVGLRAWPKKFEKRQMLWVESFWKLNTPTQENYRLYFRAEPKQKTSMPEWGRSMDHDPCDWLWPTSRWEPGKIYRDLYGLRPPQPRQLENVPLRLTIALVSNSNQIEKVRLPEEFELSFGFTNKTRQKSRVKAQKQRFSPVTYKTDFPQLEGLGSLDDTATWNAAQLALISGGEWLVEPPKGWFVRSVVAGIGFIDKFPAPTLFIGHDSIDRAKHEQYSRMPLTNFDRHKVLSEVVGSVAGAIVSKPVDGLPENFPLLLVEDPIRCFIELGLAARQRYRNPVIAITGSVGKSTVTHLIDHINSGLGASVLATALNYNSRVGAPGLLASLSPSYQAAVVEIAQSALWMRRGPITSLIKPTISVVTAIDITQVRPGVRSLRDVAKWKSRVFTGLSGAKIAIISSEIPYFEEVLQEAKKHANRIVTYGIRAEDCVQIASVVQNDFQLIISLIYQGRSYSITLDGSGEGLAKNVAAAFCVCLELGFAPLEITQTLQNYSASDSRMEIETINAYFGELLLIDDGFNATYLSMVNALTVLQKGFSGKRKIALLGRIVHLEELAKEIHQNLKQPVLDSGVNLVVTHGPEMLYLREVLPASILGPHFDTAKDTVEYLKEILCNGDVLLVKGSRRNSDFKDIVPLLKEGLSIN
ncbi:MAG TPA: CapA family protein [Paenalcaligenes sp.]|nr:CapA family protein [Paenalcaligenes sp.]